LTMPLHTHMYTHEKEAAMGWACRGESVRQGRKTLGLTAAAHAHLHTRERSCVWRLEWHGESAEEKTRMGTLRSRKAERDIQERERE
jgi:hypothetical protein